ncbi:MAG: CapA family protein [Thermodesulfobacteriota bacterium]
MNQKVGLGPSQATLMAVGDIMMHGSNIQYAYDRMTRTYDFSPYFEYTSPVFEQADWVLGNLETRLAGPKAKYTGYPLFNAPEALALALRMTGFTVLSTANNHSLDRGRDGIYRTNETLDAAGLLHTGTYLSPEDRDTVRILKKGDLSLAVLAYTYGTNGLPIPKGGEYLVNLIDLAKISQDVARARELEADFIACVLHFGVEYMRHPNEAQVETVTRLFDLGVDLVLGSHPHVVQPYQIRGENGHRQAVIYSLGNFIGGQKGQFTNLGVIFKIVLTKDVDGNRQITGVEALPTRILRLVKDNKKTFRVVPIQWALEHKTDHGLSEALMAELEQELIGLDKHLRSMTT